MATQVAGLFVSIGADTSEFRKQMNKLKANIRKDLGSEALSVSKNAAAVMTGIGAAIAAVGIKAAVAAGKVEQYRVAFTTLLKSADAADAKLKEMRAFAMKTPFSFDDVASATKRLMAMGFAAKDTETVLSAVGDAASALGLGSDGINRLTLALGQMNAKGKVSAEEMKQLTEAGVGAWDYLAKSMNISTAEAMDMVQKRMIDSGTGIKAILSGINADMGGMMAEQGKTILGRWEQLKDGIEYSLSSIGDRIVKAFDIGGKIDAVTNAVQNFAITLESSGISEALRTTVPPEVSFGLSVLAGIITAAAVPAFGALAISALTALVPLLPYIAVGAAVGAAFWLMWEAGFDFKEMLFVAGTVILAYLTPAIWTMSTAMITRLIPAIISTTTGIITRLIPSLIAGSLYFGGLGVAAKTAAVAIYAALAPILIFLGKLILTAAVVAATAYLIYSNWGSIKSLFKGIGQTLFSAFKGAAVVIAVFAYTAYSLWQWLAEKIASILQYVANIIVGVITRVGEKFSGMGDTFDGVLDGIKSLMPDWAKDMYKSFLDFIRPALEAVDKLSKSLNKLFDWGSDGSSGGFGGGDDKDESDGSISTIEKYRKKISEKIQGLTLNSGGAVGAKDKKKGLNPTKEAEKVSKSITDAWRGVSQSQIGELNDWYSEMAGKLEKYKAYNENYQRDLTRLQEVEAIKRAKIVRDETSAMENDYRDFSRSVKDMQSNAFSLNLEGGQLMDFNLVKQFEDQMRQVEDFVTKAYDTMYEAEEQLRKAQASGDAAEIARVSEHYKKMSGMAVQAEQAAADMRLEIQKQYYTEVNSLHNQYGKVKADLDAMYNKLNLEGYIQYLDDKTASDLSYYEGLQSLMNTYRELQMAANMSDLEIMAEMYKSAYQNISSGLTDAIMGAKSFGQAMKDAGKAIIETYVKMRMQQIVAAALSKSLQTAAAVASIAQAKVLAAAWEGPAKLASIATQGAAVAIGMAALETAMAASLAGKGLDVTNTGDKLPQKASGGITTGAAIAMVGEGKYQEAILPLSNRILAPIFGAAMEDAGGSSAELSKAEVNIYGPVYTKEDHESFMNDINWAIKSARGG